MVCCKTHHALRRTWPHSSVVHRDSRHDNWPASAGSSRSSPKSGSAKGGGVEKDGGGIQERQYSTRQAGWRCCRSAKFAARYGEDELRQPEPDNLRFKRNHSIRITSKFLYCDF